MSSSSGGSDFNDSQHSSVLREYVALTRDCCNCKRHLDLVYVERGFHKIISALNRLQSLVRLMLRCIQG